MSVGDGVAKRKRIATRILAVSVFTFIVGGQARAVFLQREDFPFSSASMFSYYVAKDDPLYRIELVLERAEGPRRLVGDDLGMKDEAMRRGFFSSYYGSADAGFAQGRGDALDRPRWELRMNEYCDRLHTVLQHRNVAATGLHVDVQKFTPDGKKMLESHLAWTCAPWR